MNNTLAERIKQARKYAGLTQKELADKVGLSQTAVHKIECGRSASSRRTVSIALTCGVDPVWLDTGRGDMALPGGALNVGEDGVATRTYPLLARVPLITWDELAKYCGESVENFKPESRSWIPVAPKASEHTFALKVPDDSMVPEFQEGEIIVIDPMVKSSHNQFLVAREGTNRPTFKRLIDHGNIQYLKPLNDRYPMIEVKGGIHVCGVVVCKYKEYP
ncbi:MAG: phage repressor protein, Serine peptidase, MEROPS family S24 [Magnetococcales bacterium]|nr:phage repressor protein, Serine peptidase, MEROPS family S24 [Magnetococcales bacterium]HIJ83478.1 helix-turn-helix domain-containing protein [Magnetococcales bacterium]